MMVFGLRVSEMPPFVQKKLSILMAFEHNVYHQELWDMLEWLVGCDEQLGSVP
jgi:hypothetical protein